ncbi:MULTISPECIES: Gfo/Idh/MocA family protein [Caldilinea]|jgi:predicted dehydrogenase|nr:MULTISPECIES: Gfo/Idh/MocA family oxidoreductase [Caldilinea]MBO9393190.1 Gfo/Idh/MocA family oxidoreductase [Caldilinea sp.]GIV74625.1 MAG: dehydrogenase [Caldilinea sp.]
MSMFPEWRVAVIGAGTISQRVHIPVFQKQPNTTVVAVCDVNEARARAVAEETGVAAVYSDYEKMLQEIQPNITVVATPNVFHKPMAIAALEAGSHVLCEKPVALTYADAQVMFATAAAQKRVLTVGTHFRFTAPMQAAKRHAEQGFFGRIYAARTVWQRRNGIPGYGSWFTNKDLAGGGALLDIGVHTLDRALYIMGYPRPRRVSGAMFAEFGPRGRGLGGWGADILQPSANARYDVDDVAWAQVVFEDGAVLQFQVAWASNYPETFVTEIFGNEGGAYIGGWDSVQLYAMLNGLEVKIETELPAQRGSSYEQLINNFVRRLEGDESADIVTPEQALVHVQIVDAIMRSATEGCEVTL